MDVFIDSMSKKDWPAVKIIYAEGLATGLAAFTTVTPSWSEWDQRHFEFGRLVARLGSQTTGWAALAPVPDN